jgi:hypothetical protein
MAFGQIVHHQYLHIIFQIRKVFYNPWDFFFFNLQWRKYPFCVKSKRTGGKSTFLQKSKTLINSLTRVMPGMAQYSHQF